MNYSNKPWFFPLYFCKEMILDKKKLEADRYRILDFLRNLDRFFAFQMDIGYFLD
jgi:hypothetical protein